MQSLDVISINLWQIVVSLINLLLLCLIIKIFLFKPVKKMLQKRQSELDEKYKLAYDAISRANSDEEYWKEKREHASAEAEGIIQDAFESAKRKEEKIIDDATLKAEDMLRRVKEEIAIEREKAQDSIKKEIVEVSTAIAEKILAREIDIKDHQRMIDSAIENIGD